MLKREQLLKEISDSLGNLELSTRNRGNLRFYDQHIVAETFVANLLNIIYGYNLINLNIINSTYAAADLGDFEKKLCFQVTYTIKNNHRAKIKNSIEKFIKNQMYKEFEKLKFLFLGPKQEKYNKSFDTQGHFQFDPYQDVINLQDLVKSLPSLTTNELERITDLIDDEFKGLGIVNHVEHQSDRDALIVYKAAFNRPALQDRFSAEGNYQGFEDALTELITLMKTGVLKGQIVAKTTDVFSNLQISQSLEELYHKIRELRSLYNTYKRTGDIVPSQNIAYFKSPEVSEAFDKLKQDVIDHINQIMIQEQLTPPIRGCLR